VFKSGFVNIIGRPNVGKSTLMNTLVGERMSIITNKPQTTRHRIIGIVGGENFQIVFSDTPGVITDPKYKMQEKMNSYALSALEDADLLLLMTDGEEPISAMENITPRIKLAKLPKFLIINKIDQKTDEQITELENAWCNEMSFDKIFRISALEQKGTAELLKEITDRLPEGPQYYPEDQLTDRPERFFVAEIIREKILMSYYQEIPYSVEVSIESFKEDPVKPLTRISAIVYCERESQKNILIGPKGSAIKNVGILARKDIETWLQRQVFLEIHIKIRDNWRNDEKQLNRFGYDG
jgi:GTP-binding protein Era